MELYSDYVVDDTQLLQNVLVEEPELLVEVGRAYVAVQSHGFRPEQVVRGGVDVQLRVGARREVGQGGDDRLV